MDSFEIMADHTVLSNVKNQIVSTIIGTHKIQTIQKPFWLTIIFFQRKKTANCVIFSFGNNMGWLSPALPVLLSNETPLKTGPLSNAHLSWIGAANSCGAICSTFIMVVLSTRWGSKQAMTFLAYPAIAFWLLVYFGDTFYHILLARFANGLTGIEVKISNNYYLLLLNYHLLQ